MKSIHVSDSRFAIFQYKFWLLTYKMDMNEKDAINDVLNILEVEPEVSRVA